MEGKRTREQRKFQRRENLKEGGLMEKKKKTIKNQ